MLSHVITHLIFCIKEPARLCSCDSVLVSRDSIFSIFQWCMKYELCMKMKVMLLLSGTYVLNYEHVILYIHMYEPYSCTIKFMLFIICQLLIIAYIIIYIYRFKVFMTGSICPIQNNWTGGSTGSKRFDLWSGPNNLALVRRVLAMMGSTMSG
jgi:hypothetical protein